jgi:uncharacterized membrane protein required for colicin V production
VLVLDLILGAVFVLAVLWGVTRGVTANTLALVGFGAGAVVGARVAPLVLNGGLHSTYAPEAAIPGALVLGAVAAALVERFGLRARRGLARLGRAGPVGGGLLGAVLGLMVVWIIGTVAIEIDALRNDVRKSEILRRLDAVLTPPGPRLVEPTVYADPFPTFVGPSPGVGPITRIVTRAPGVRAASQRVMRVQGRGCGHAGEGTGWVVADGVIATNAHVVAGKQLFVAEFRSQPNAYPATPIWFDPKHDVALLRVPGVRGVPALTMVAHARAGTPAATLGFPGGNWKDRPALLGTTSNQYTGTLNNVREAGPEFPSDLFGRLIIGFSGLIEPGSSGSPVVDGTGHVLGMAFAGGGSFGWAVPDAFIRNALRRAGPPVATGPCPAGSHH